MYRYGRCRTYDKYKQTAAEPAAGPGSSRIAAPADRSTASAVLAAGGGTARLLAGAGSCTATKLARRGGSRCYRVKAIASTQG